MSQHKILNEFTVSILERFWDQRYPDFGVRVGRHVCNFSPYFFFSILGIALPGNLAVSPG